MTFEKTRFFILGCLIVFITNAIKEVFFDVYKYNIPIEIAIILIALVIFLRDYKDFNSYKEGGGK